MAYSGVCCARSCATGDIATCSCADTAPVADDAASWAPSVFEASGSATAPSHVDSGATNCSSIPTIDANDVAGNQGACGSAQATHSTGWRGSSGSADGSAAS